MALELEDVEALFRDLDEATATGADTLGEYRDALLTILEYAQERADQLEDEINQQGEDYPI